jgi:hypothetical protein
MYDRLWSCTGVLTNVVIWWSDQDPLYFAGALCKCHLHFHTVYRNILNQEVNSCVKVKICWDVNSNYCPGWRGSYVCSALKCIHNWLYSAPRSAAELESHAVLWGCIEGFYFKCILNLYSKSVTVYVAVAADMCWYDSFNVWKRHLFSPKLTMCYLCKCQ